MSDLRYFSARYCARCRADTPQEIVRHISSSGGEQFAVWCLPCDAPSPLKEGGAWIPKDRLAKHLGTDDFSFLRTTRDLRLSAARCGRCLARGVELHHWAPSALFGREEANKWPTDYLCIDCHRRWHGIVTPQLVRAA